VDFTVIERSGMTQQQFATIAGVSRVTANQWCRGKVAPNRYIEEKVKALLRHMEFAIKHKYLPLAITVKPKERLARIKAQLIVAIKHANSLK
jgi:DNA-binding XRE family transcriptional regulator